MTHAAESVFVTLVGAGPGDPELLTLKAVKALQQASVILVDDLVHPDVLQHANPQARVVHVGKRGGCQSTPQAFIEKLMAQEALAGERVVRLKGGDPLLLGRAGEEIAYLLSQGVSIKIVNGVTSGLAAANTLGLSLTHRAYSHGAVMITGHSHTLHADIAPIDWEMLGRTAHACRLTLVIYMGVASAKVLQNALLKSMPSDTPVAVVHNASGPDQRSVIGNLSALHTLIHEAGMQSPAIILVGDVLKTISDFNSMNNVDQEIYAMAVTAT
jgi:uroporphyrin-III C-methyltransferase